MKLLARPKSVNFATRFGELAGDQNVLIFEVAMNVALRMRERERVERLRDDRNAVFVRESAALLLGKLWKRQQPSTNSVTR